MPNLKADMRLWGRFEHSLDEKGRLVIPARFREKLGEEFVLTVGPEGSIRAYPLDVWESLGDQLSTVSLASEMDTHLGLLQRLFGNCEFVKPDREFRISVPRFLRQWAELEESSSAILIGGGTRLEIWSRERWHRINDSFRDNQPAEASAKLHAALGLLPAAAGKEELEAPAAGA